MNERSPAAESANRQICRIHLVRHGQTIMNTQVRFRGRLDVPLNEVGRAEARLEAAPAAPPPVRRRQSSVADPSVGPRIGDRRFPYVHPS